MTSEHGEAKKHRSLIYCCKRDCCSGCLETVVIRVITHLYLQFSGRCLTPVVYVTVRIYHYLHVKYTPDQFHRPSTGNPNDSRHSVFLAGI
jgi:hypothetical protein